MSPGLPLLPLNHLVFELKVIKLSTIVVKNEESRTTSTLSLVGAVAVTKSLGAMYLCVSKSIKCVTKTTWMRDENVRHSIGKNYNLPLARLRWCLLILCCFDDKTRAIFFLLKTLALINLPMKLSQLAACLLEAYPKREKTA